MKKEADIGKELGDGFRIYIDDHDKQTIRFVYPQSFSDDSIIQEIRLEIGALSAWTPVTRKSVTPYAAEQYMNKFTRPSTEILTVDAQRTFWEKITILHSEFHRPANKQIPQRYSRHYYDVFRLGKSPIKESAYKDIALLEKVVDFKKRFYYAGWSNYDTARIGTLKLMPPDRNLDALKEDYVRMRNMLFGEQPAFDEILTYINKMEIEINILN